MLNVFYSISACLLLANNSASAFTSPLVASQKKSVAFAPRLDTSLNAEGKFARDVTGAELEVMLTEWDQPLVLDAYATWCGPCLMVRT